jgi:hypothetical protein
MRGRRTMAEQRAGLGQQQEEASASGRMSSGAPSSRASTRLSLAASPEHAAATRRQGRGQGRSRACPGELLSEFQVALLSCWWLPSVIWCDSQMAVLSRGPQFKDSRFCGPGRRKHWTSRCQSIQKRPSTTRMRVLRRFGPWLLAMLSWPSVWPSRSEQICLSR